MLNRLESLEKGFKEDLKINREENAGIAKENRSELNESMRVFKAELMMTLQQINLQQQQTFDKINITLETKLDALIRKIDDNNTVNREVLSRNLKDFALDQRINFEQLNKEQKEFRVLSAEQLEKIKEGMLSALKSFQESF